jgi:lipid II:glycine glycyltransferase (peptidoglycan interpeptide bridge formation enzyme)
MIKYFKKTGPLKIYEIWFNHQSSLLDFFKIFGVFHLKNNKKIYGVQSISHTIEIDLTQPEEKVFSDISKSNKQDYRKAQDDNFIIEETTDLAAFANFFNDFAKQRNTFLTSEKRLLEKLPYLHVYLVKQHGVIISAQSYLLDEEEKIVRFYQSSSLRLNDDIDKTMVARSTKYLLINTILKYQQKGYKIFDLGGYAMDTTDEGLKGINNFKTKFGGEIVECKDYYSYPYWLIKKISKLIGYSATL